MPPKGQGNRRFTSDFIKFHLGPLRGEPRAHNDYGRGKSRLIFPGENPVERQAAEDTWSERVIGGITEGYALREDGQNQDTYRVSLPEGTLHELPGGLRTDRAGAVSVGIIFDSQRGSLINHMERVGRDPVYGGVAAAAAASAEPSVAVEGNQNQAVGRSSTVLLSGSGEATAAAAVSAGPSVAVEGNQNQAAGRASTVLLSSDGGAAASGGTTLLGGGNRFGKNPAITDKNVVEAARIMSEGRTVAFASMRKAVNDFGGPSAVLKANGLLPLTESAAAASAAPAAAGRESAADQPLTPRRRSQLLEQEEQRSRSQLLAGEDLERQELTKLLVENPMLAAAAAASSGSEGGGFATVAGIEGGLATEAELAGGGATAGTASTLREGE